MGMLKPIIVSNRRVSSLVFSTPVSSYRSGRPGKLAPVRLVTGCNPTRSVRYDCQVIGRHKAFEGHRSGFLGHPLNLSPVSSNWWSGQIESPTKKLSSGFYIVTAGSNDRVRRLILWSHKPYSLYNSILGRSPKTSDYERIFPKWTPQVLIWSKSDPESEKLRATMEKNHHCDNSKFVTQDERTGWTALELEKVLRSFRIEPEVETIMIMAPSTNSNFAQITSYLIGKSIRQVGYGPTPFVAVLESYSAHPWRRDPSLQPNGKWEASYLAKSWV